MTDQSIFKPAVVGAVAVVLDKYWMGERDMMRSMYFGGAVAVGNYASEYIAPLVNFIPIPTISKGLYDGKTLVDRIAEVSSSAGFAYMVNKYLLNNDPYTGELMKRIGVIAVADVVGTYIVEYTNNQQLQFLTDVRA
jgi:hypothetical protein